MTIINVIFQCKTLDFFFYFNKGTRRHLSEIKVPGVNEGVIVLTCWLKLFFNSSRDTLNLGFNKKFVHLFKAIFSCSLFFFRSLSILTHLIITMEEAFLGCLADISLIFKLHSTHACQGLNEAVHLPPDAQWQSVCVHDGAIVSECECAYLFGYLSSSK